MFPVLWFINLYEMRQLNLVENLRFYNNLVITSVIHLYSMSLNIFFYTLSIISILITVKYMFIQSIDISGSLIC